MRLTGTLFNHAVLAGGAFASVVLAVGLGLGLTGRFGEHLGAPAPARAEPARVHAGYLIVALGDSLTAGTGDGRAGGYPARLARMLREKGQDAAVVNLAVPGAETTDVLERLQGESQLRQVRQADLILVSAGANDLMHTLRPSSSGRSLGDPERALPVARANLKILTARLRAANPTAAIRLIGLYSPFEVAPGEEEAARDQLLAWNDVIEQATHGPRDILAIPVFDLFEGRPERLAADHYHPGPRGHELIARRVLDSLRDP